jgi:hypothetical protein
VRTWEDNKAAMNQLWPTHIWQEEEKKLLNDDLSPLDQDTLYDAIRNVKRHRDTPFVHLKWFLDEYRSLCASKKHATKRSKPKDPKLDINIDDERDHALCDEFVGWIDGCQPQQFQEVEEAVLDRLSEMHAASAVRVLDYARARLLGQETQFSRVTKDGDLKPMVFTKKGWQ